MMCPLIDILRADFSTGKGVHRCGYRQCLFSAKMKLPLRSRRTCPARRFAARKNAKERKGIARARHRCGGAKGRRLQRVDGKRTIAAVAAIRDYGMPINFALDRDGDKACLVSTFIYVYIRLS